MAISIYELVINEAESKMNIRLDSSFEWLDGKEFYFLAPAKVKDFS